MVFVSSNVFCFNAGVPQGTLLCSNILLFILSTNTCWNQWESWRGWAWVQNSLQTSSGMLENMMNSLYRAPESNWCLLPCFDFTKVRTDQKWSIVSIFRLELPSSRFPDLTLSKSVRGMVEDWLFSILRPFFPGTQDEYYSMSLRICPPFYEYSLHVMTAISSHWTCHEI